MYTHRQLVKTYLINSTLGEYNTIIKKAKLTPKQQRIARLKFRLDKKNYQIAMIMDYSDSFVDKELAKIYDALDRAIDTTCFCCKSAVL